MSAVVTVKLGFDFSLFSVFISFILSVYQFPQLGGDATSYFGGFGLRGPQWLFIDYLVSS